VLEDANGRTTDIFVYDQQTESIELLTIGGNGDSVTPAISADGRFVAFTSQSNNLVTPESVPGPDDTNDLFNLFVHDRVMGATELLTADADNSSFQPSISSDGRFVAFSSDATNLVDEDLNGGGQDFFVHDRNAGTTRLLTPGGDFGSVDPSISADGQLIAFTSDARNLVEVDPTVDADILVFDQNTDTVSVNNSRRRRRQPDCINKRRRPKDRVCLSRPQSRQRWHSQFIRCIHLFRQCSTRCRFVDNDNAFRRRHPANSD